MRAQPQSQAIPCIEMITSIDRSTRPLRPPHRNILLESPGAVDRRSIGAGIGANIIGTAIAGDSAPDSLTSARIIFSNIFENVVLGFLVLARVDNCDWRALPRQADFSSIHTRSNKHSHYSSV